MKTSKATLGKALDAPDPAIRFYLFHGPDEAGSRALADRLLAGLKAEKAALSGDAIKADPGLLPGEAGAISLFGETRALWIEPAGDEIAAGVDALLGAAAVESVVIAIGGALRATSTLRKTAEASVRALAHISYEVDGRDATRLVIELGQGEGLRIASDVAARIAAAAGLNRAIIASELEKFALYLGATRESPATLDHEAIDEVGADNGEAVIAAVGDLALDGRLSELVEQLQRLAPGAPEALPIVRSLQRRLLQLAPLRARVEAGERVDGVLASMGKALFWKDKDKMQRLLSIWSAARLSQVAERAARLEKQVMLSSAPTDATLGEELIAIARAGRR